MILGSGLMAPTLIDYFTKFKDTHITVGSNVLEEALKLAKKSPKFVSAVHLDITNVYLLYWQW